MHVLRMYECMYTVYNVCIFVCRLGMHICLCMCMYVCMYVDMYVCLYVYMYVCLHIYMYVCMHECMYVSMYVVCMYVRQGM